jgi:hypothetical protein
MADQEGQSNVSLYALGGLLLAWVLVALYFYFPRGSGEPTIQELETQALTGAPEVRVQATMQLIKLKDKGLESLRKVAQKAPDAESKALAIAGLGGLWDFDSMDLILAGLEDESEVVRIRSHVTIEQMLGMRIPFNATDPPAQRQQAVKKMHAEWKALQAGPLLQELKDRLKKQDPSEMLQ